MTTITKTTNKPKTPAPAKDATALLRADHAAVNALFADYEKTRSDAKKKALVAEICTALSVHAQIEEEIFYPAVKAALKDKLLVPEATVEHGGIKDLIAQLEGVEPDGEMYDAKVKVLSEHVKHHVKEEQNDMFPKVKASSLVLRPALFQTLPPDLFRGETKGKSHAVAGRTGTGISVGQGAYRGRGSVFGKRHGSSGSYKFL